MKSQQQKPGASRAIRCEWCERDSGRIHWANRSGQYLRDLDDWFQLCPPCHARYDGQTVGTERHGPTVRERFADASHEPDVKTEIECTCAGCGGSFLVKPSPATRRRYCSKACYLAARSSGVYRGRQVNKD